MCFFIDLNNSKPIISDYDTMCYKVVTVTFRRSWNPFSKKPKVTIEPFYRRDGFKYTLNKRTPKVKLAEVSKGTYVIDEGYHSFYSVRQTQELIGDTSILSTLKAMILRQPEIYALAAECIIPRGTPFYKNDNDNKFVSESIIITKLL